MAKKMCMAFLVLLCVFSFPLIPVEAAEDVIENNENGIPDEGLYRSILGRLDKKENETFTRQEAESIEMMWIDSWNKGRPGSYRVLSFKGLGYLKNLKELTVTGQKLKAKHLEEIAGEAPQLEALSLRDNEIESLLPLKDMKNLQYLWVPNNCLKSLEGIEGLSQLISLEAYENQLTDVAPLKNLTNLSDVHLSGNQLKDVSGLESLKSLRWLELYNNELKKLPNLKSLKLLYVADFTCNYLPEKELKSKLPKQLLRIKQWKNKQIKFQKSNFKIVVTAPKNAAKISRNTTKIAGKIVTKFDSKKYSVQLRLFDFKKSKYVRGKVDQNGNFVFDGLNLKKLKGGQAEILVALKDFDTEDGGVVNRAVFTIK